jgi:hypothetical protein
MYGYRDGVQVGDRFTELEQDATEQDATEQDARFDVDADIIASMEAAGIDTDAVDPIIDSLSWREKLWARRRELLEADVTSARLEVAKARDTLAAYIVECRLWSAQASLAGRYRSPIKEVIPGLEKVIRNLQGKGRYTPVYRPSDSTVARTFASNALALHLAALRHQIQQSEASKLLKEFEAEPLEG